MGEPPWQTCWQASTHHCKLLHPQAFTALDCKSCCIICFWNTHFWRHLVWQYIVRVSHAIEQEERRCSDKVAGQGRGLKLGLAITFGTNLRHSGNLCHFPVLQNKILCSWATNGQISVLQSFWACNVFQGFSEQQTQPNFLSPFQSECWSITCQGVMWTLTYCRAQIFSKMNVYIRDILNANRA